MVTAFNLPQCSKLIKIKENETEIKIYHMQMQKKREKMFKSVVIYSLSGYIPIVLFLNPVQP